MYWLILMTMFIDVPRPQILHVGNFKDMQQCQAAAKEGAVIRTQTVGANVVASFICVRANGDGIEPPE